MVNISENKLVCTVYCCLGLFHHIGVCHCSSETGFDVKGNSSDELHVDPDGRVFQHHSKLGTFTLTLSSHEQWENKPSADCCLRDDVAQLRKHVQQHKDQKVGNY